MRNKLMVGLLALLVAGAPVVGLPSAAYGQDVQEEAAAPELGDEAVKGGSAKGEKGEAPAPHKEFGRRGSFRYRHGHPGRPGPGFWHGMKGGRGPLGPGAGRWGMGFGMGPGLWDVESLPEELRTPELEASIERAKEAREAARSAAVEAVKAGKALMEARLDVMEAWLEAARAAGKITDEQYERMRERHDRAREALEKRAEAWRQRWSERGPSDN